jgi:hypothetical protein
VLSLWSFQGARRPAARLAENDRNPLLFDSIGTVSQNSTAYGLLRRGRRCFQANRVIGRRSSRGTTSTSSAPAGVNRSCIPRKEVIQPQLPLRLPCYDFTPIINPTFDGCLPKRVSPPASGIANFRGVTGGVYKARERIHRDVADSRLLATPPSWRRVSASNPNRDRLFGIRSASRHRSPLYRPM